MILIRNAPGTSFTKRYKVIISIIKNAIILGDAKFPRETKVVSLATTSPLF